MWPIMLRELIRRMEAWAQRLWQSSRAFAPSSRRAVTPEQRQPDTPGGATRGKAKTSVDDYQDESPSAQPPETHSGVDVLDPTDTEDRNDNLAQPPEESGRLAGNSVGKPLNDDESTTPMNEEGDSRHSKSPLNTNHPTSSCGEPEDMSSDSPKDASGKSQPPEDHRSTPSRVPTIGDALGPKSGNVHSGPQTEAESRGRDLSPGEPQPLGGKEEERRSLGPRGIGGRRHPTTSNDRTKTTTAPVSRPELICRKGPGHAQWEIALSADGECRISNANHNGQLLDLLSPAKYYDTFW